MCGGKKSLNYFVLALVMAVREPLAWLVLMRHNEKVLKKAGFRSTTLPPTTNDNKMQTLQLTDNAPLSFNTVLCCRFGLKFLCGRCISLCSQI